MIARHSAASVVAAAVIMVQSAAFGASKTVTVKVNADSEVVWWLRMPPKWGLYRADRIEPYYGHVVDSDTD